MLVISNRPRALRSSDFEFTRAITPRIVLHSVQLLLHIYLDPSCDVIVVFLLRYDSSLLL